MSVGYGGLKEVREDQLQSQPAETGLRVSRGGAEGGGGEKRGDVGAGPGQGRDFASQGPLEENPPTDCACPSNAPDKISLRPGVSVAPRHCAVSSLTIIFDAQIPSVMRRSASVPLKK